MDISVGAPESRAEAVSPLPAGQSMPTSGSL